MCEICNPTGLEDIPVKTLCEKHMKEYEESWDQFLEEEEREATPLQ